MTATSKAPWIALAYGYVVCLVAVITFIIGMTNFVDAVFDRANPMEAQGRFGGASLTSFDAFHATYDKREVYRGKETPQDTLTTAELRSRYEALRSDRASQVRYTSSRELVGYGLMMLLSIALFAFHWRWVRRQRETGGEGA